MSNWDTIRGEILVDRQTYIVAALSGDHNSHQLIPVRRPRVRLCPFSHRRLENGIEMLVQDEPHRMTDAEIRRLQRVLRQRQRQREADRAAEMEADLICNEEIFESEDESTEEERQQDRDTADRRARERQARVDAFNQREEEIMYTNRIYDQMVERQRRARRE